MKVELSLYATLEKYLPPEAGHSPFPIECDPGTTIRGLLQRIGMPFEVAKIIFLNGLHAQGDEVLKEGDHVGIFPPLGGG
jgi:molybdopterin converting factor small subunit